jgi:NAD(P)-dependent dehydrogenase (short-subunit alcohol dehydrogenase family)
VSDTAPTPIDPNGSTAVVTGGASGIGRAIASELLARGARVVVADVEAPALDRTVGELSELADGTDRVIGVRTGRPDLGLGRGL